MEVHKMTGASTPPAVPVRSTSATTPFSEHLSALSTRITCKRAESYQEREAIFHLRYQSYLRAGILSTNPFARFTDDADRADNTYLFALHVDGRLASSLRLHVRSPRTPQFPSLALFPHALRPLLEDGKGIVDLSYVVANEPLSRQHRFLPYITLRPWIMAAEHFEAKHLVAAVKLEHLPFYERAFNCQVHAEVRQLPHLCARASLVTLDFESAAKHLYGKHPFLRSSPSERRRIFDAQGRQATG
jgi:hypothetical protein